MLNGIVCVFQGHWRGSDLMLRGHLHFNHHCDSPRCHQPYLLRVPLPLLFSFSLVTARLSSVPAPFHGSPDCIDPSLTSWVFSSDRVSAVPLKQALTQPTMGLPFPSEDLPVHSLPLVSVLWSSQIVYTELITSPMLSWVLGVHEWSPVGSPQLTSMETSMAPSLQGQQGVGVERGAGNPGSHRGWHA